MFIFNKIIPILSTGICKNSLRAQDALRSNAGLRVAKSSIQISLSAKLINKNMAVQQNK
jgi:hypothetical protein